MYSIRTLCDESVEKKHSYKVLGFYQLELENCRIFLSSLSELIFLDMNYPSYYIHLQVFWGMFLPA